MEGTADFRTCFHEDICAGWLTNPHISALEKQVVGRIAHLGLTLISIPLGIIEIAIGIISSVGVLLTLTLHSPTNKFARNSLLTGPAFLIVSSYTEFLKTLNPNASFKSIYNGGVFSYVFCKTLNSIYLVNLNSNNVLRNQLCTRVIALSGIPINIIGSAIDLPIGLIAATFSIITLGTFKKANMVALASLTGSIHVIKGIFCSIVCTFNPWAFQ